MSANCLLWHCCYKSIRFPVAFSVPVAPLSGTALVCLILFSFLQVSHIIYYLSCIIYYTTVYLSVSDRFESEVNDTYGTTPYSRRVQNRTAMILILDMNKIC